MFQVLKCLIVCFRCASKITALHSCFNSACLQYLFVAYCIKYIKINNIITFCIVLYCVINVWINQSWLANSDLNALRLCFNISTHESIGSFGTIKMNRIGLNHEQIQIAIKAGLNQSLTTSSWFFQRQESLSWRDYTIYKSDQSDQTK